MLYPRFDHVRELSRSYSTIPLCKTIFADTETPIGLYRRLKNRNYSFLLESAEGGEKWGRYSFIGTDPFLIFRSKGQRITVQEGTNVRRYSSERPLAEFHRLLERYRAPRYPGYPPFLGGAVGYAGYEAVTTFEKVPRHQGERDTAFEDLYFLFSDRMLIFDHLKKEIMLVANLHVPKPVEDEALRSAYHSLAGFLEGWAAELSRTPAETGPFPSVAMADASADFSRVQSNMEKAAYCQMVERAKEHIRRGDIYQIVLSQRWTWDAPPDPFDVYRVLRALNPSPYMYYLSLGEEKVVGASPELLVRVTDGEVETRPIAGTRPRGRKEEEDRQLEEELLRDEKERAEHVMLLDLGRNDVGRVSRYGSVRVTEQMTMERYSHVMHMVSHVRGQLREDAVPADAFASCFPAGTVSGSPKVRAMELIAEMEPTPRGIYAGSIGYFSFTGNLDSAITIRTIHFKNGIAYIQAGGGIVADSVPELEYEESRNKARSLMRALTLAEKMFSTVQG
ncbi:anthranilate synthase component I [Marinithermofilum abyssi]|uniref:Anthranilate synthase component 1 n=1 Tax=Marinithermofilum abyssi TaxID=1571185 RepID=A0A8J2VEK4_9BACL|nr:anthranilate synthase component I [Marinithermofilum abyssi]GGE11337.1 anthranilate synthase component I [Marinithermofilum abyssi]